MTISKLDKSVTVTQLIPFEFFLSELRGRVVAADLMLYIVKLESVTSSVGGTRLRTLKAKHGRRETSMNQCVYFSPTTDDAH